MTSIEIREERESDHDDIHQVTQRAFSGKPYAEGDEQEVIHRLRHQDALLLSLVAIDAGKLIGQVSFSPAEASDGSGPWYALGPVSVSPERQGEGIDGALIEEGLARIEAVGALGCILTGNPDYYQRFGFRLSPVNVPDREPAAYFMLKLLNGQRPEGVFSFHGAFYGDG